MGVREDQGLLYGLLAFQNNFVSRADLLAAFGVWIADKSVGLDQLLCQRGQLSEADQAILRRLCERHLASNGGDPTATLAKLSVETPIHTELQQFADTDLNKSLAHLRTIDPLATQAVGGSSATGGRFCILRPLDRGGLGVVSVALDRELNREVAIKQIREDRADEVAYRNKFVLEAEVTGGLEHPGIVPVYGLGKGDDGRPYYAMRLIRGDNLRTHILELHESVKGGRETFDGTRLRQLLRRFLDVCDAVAYAHSRGVLHRDLKPANIMVGKYGETLLVDWGLAKTIGKEGVTAAASADKDLATAERLLTPSGSDANLTVQGHAIGTAAYAAPEQLSGSLDSINERSDVYGLGAILYEILTGTPPVEGKSLEEMTRKAIKNQIRLPREIQPKVPKGIAAISIKALSGNPDHRYQSATDLKIDVEAWLDDEPVTALQESATGHAARWLRKNRAFAAATSIGLLALSIVSLVFAGTFNAQKLTAEKLSREARQAQRDAVEKQEEAELATAERNVALADVKTALEKSQRAASTSDRLSQFVTGIFQASDPIGIDSVPFLLPKRSTADMSLATALQLGAERMHEELGDEPLVLAKVMQSIGSAFRSLGKYQDAIKLMRESLALRREHGDEDQTELSLSLQNLTVAELEAGDFLSAEMHIREAMAISQNLENGELAVADCQFYLAWIKGQSYRVVEGERLFRKCLETRSRLLGINDRKTRFAQLGLAFCLLEQGRIIEASGFALTAGSALRTTERENPAVHIVSDFLAAVIKAKMFGAAMGESQLKSVLKTIEVELGKDTVYNALVRFELARFIKEQGRHEEAAEQLAICWEDAKRLSELRHPKILVLARDYADLLKLIERYDQGLDVLTQFRNAQIETYGPQSEPAYLAEFAWLTYQQDRMESSEYWPKVDTLVKKMFEKAELSRESLQYIEQLAIYYSELETKEGYQQAEHVYEQMWNHLGKLSDKTDSDWGILAAVRISMLMKLDRLEQAMECFNTVADYAKTWSDTGARNGKDSFYFRASRLLIAVRQYDEAIKYLNLRRDLWPTDGDELYYIARDSARASLESDDPQTKTTLEALALDVLDSGLSNGFKDTEQLDRDVEIWKNWETHPLVIKLLERRGK